MPLINSSFFVRELSIPNLNTVTSGGTAIKERLDSFIAKYEPRCLLEILGYELLKAYNAAPTSQRMKDLKDGVEYTDENGDLKKWQGLVHDTDISLIANYVYFFFQDSSATQTTGVSTSANKTEAGISVSPQDKMIFAWNFFSQETSSMISFLWNQKDVDGVRVYPEFKWNQAMETKRISRTINAFSF